MVQAAFYGFMGSLFLTKFSAQLADTMTNEHYTRTVNKVSSLFRSNYD